MHTSGHRALALVIVTSAVAWTGACADANTARVVDGQPSPEANESANDPAEDPAVDSLTNDPGMSESQAIRQMETQVAAGKAAGYLPPELEAVYSGQELRHDQGGRGVVAMTDRRLADAMREHFADYGVSDVEIRIVAHTKEHLDAVAEELQRRLRESRDSQEDVHVAVGRAALGKVTVEFVDGPMNATEEEILSKARAEADTFAVLEVDHIDDGQGDDGQG